MTPYRDNSDFRDPAKINDFDYTTRNRARDLPNCPFAAHIRKTAPRNLDPLVQKEYLDAAVIIRTGIPYGPEVRLFFIAKNIINLLPRSRPIKLKGKHGGNLPLRKNLPLALVDFYLYATKHPSRMGSSSRPPVSPTMISSPLQVSFRSNTVPIFLTSTYLKLT